MKGNVSYSIRARALVLVLFALVLSVSCQGREPEGAAPSPAADRPLPVHKSPIAGSWYPGDADALRAMLEEFFGAVPDPLPGLEGGHPIAVIAPHAGYRYSGRTAAYAMAALARRSSPPDRVVILGPSHRAAFRGASVGEYRAYATPLGEALVDVEAVERLRKCPLVVNVAQANALEHSVDIEIPLLQYAFGQKTPPIVPIVVGDLSEADFRRLAQAVGEVLTSQSAVVVSSDFTHYGPDYGYVPFERGTDARKGLDDLLDRAVAAISTGRREEFAKYLEETGDTICGKLAIQTLLEMLPRSARAVRLCSDMSGAQIGDFTNSVSYVSIAFVSDEAWPAPSSAPGPATAEPGAAEDAALRAADAPTTLTAEERAALLALARRTVEAATRGDPLPDIDASLQTPPLSAKRAVFVTLRQEGELRGCIGSLVATESLAESVRSNAVNAALRDPRFPPVRAEETKDLHIEISALTVPREVDSYKDIRLGRDGIILSRGFARAVFLPQVAPEQGWTLDETLTHLSMKAGLAPTAWRDPKTRFEVFQAEVFEEH